MADDDFYVDDESPEELWDAWRLGEKGVTTGSKDLDPGAYEVIGRAVARLDECGSESAVLRSELFVVNFTNSDVQAEEGEITVEGGAMTAQLVRSA